MRISRWRAERKPTQTEIESIFKDEGLESNLEELPPKGTVNEHRHPFDEVRIILKGSMCFSIAGNEFILHEGDRVELPSNTRHKNWAGADGCVSYCAMRVS